MGINSFDQWGVELGKTMAVETASAIAIGVERNDETLTHPLLNWYLQFRKKQ
jgi:glucose-6-phosphate isomerase